MRRRNQRVCFLEIRRLKEIASHLWSTENNEAEHKEAFEDMSWLHDYRVIRDYDNIIDLDSRIEMIYEELLKLKSMNLSEWFKDNDDRFKYNYNLYKNIVNNSSNIHTILTKWVLN
jgi:hypothetical protein